MLSLRHVWIIVTDVANSLFGSPFLGQGLQYPIGAKFGASRPGIEAVKSGGPIFRPPGSNIDDFWCDYSTTMPGFEHCGTPEDQSCWLRNPTTGEEFNLLTDYEDIKQTPKGVTRVYYLNVTDGPINANGLDFRQGKLFNGTFPGPLIEACWGDTVIIHVRNHLQYNGTSIHWHGLRQWQTMHMDGVNGLTQCPIAPGSEFIYNWTAMQYGSSWYHSHYSVQYADGLQAPITIHGPSSYPYDVAIEPITITDWANNSAFQNIAPSRGGRADTMDVLLNGTGDITRFTGGQTMNTDTIPPRFELSFDDAAPNPMTGAKRYLLRLINTSFGNSFIFTIDNHNLTVIEADFVPVHNFNTTSILVAIGQRYNIIVEATPIVNVSNPSANPIPKDGNFWIRTYAPQNSDVLESYYHVDQNTYMKTGVLRYDKTSTTDPTTTGWNISDTDSDKSINDQLKPILQWSVQKPANWDNSPEVFNIVPTKGEGQYATAFVAFQRNGTTDVSPFQTTYGNPTFLNLDNVGDEWPAGWFVVPENYTDNDWIFLVIDKPKLGPHPIHLHGHDFAIVQQSDNSSFDMNNFNQNRPDVNFPRRDVVLVTKTGHAVIAFKADNPGVWLMHCHIAGHASGGLSLQIMERQKAANGIWPPGNSDALNEAHKLCASWNSWSYDCKNLWPGNTGNSQKAEYPSCKDSTNVQNDSGV
ncbi:Laccase [Colletotrichum gloeosporioides]|uniref:Laccase n=1 Tax=Colletotrichum gloeosporioides TaxID=474922 RepID=A0A8H4FDY4_COLGL|nr:Laccase [Colletotrichum gloeosporioides]KAF3798798.1 Laccase [Colletotrichum gloeosporioides]